MNVVIIAIVLVVWLLLLSSRLAEAERQIERLKGGNLNSQQRIDRLENANNND